MDQIKSEQSTPRTFQYAPGPHAPQLAIEAHDLTLAECQKLKAIVTNQWIDTDSYKLGRACGAFLQGYEEPRGAVRDGWVLVEFWTSNVEAVCAFVAHVNALFAQGVRS